MAAFDTSALKPVGQQPLPSAAPANLDFSSLRPVNSNSPVAPAAPTTTSPAPAGNDDFLGQVGAGLVTGIPNAVAGLAAAGERGRKMGLIVPGMDIIGGMIEPVIDPLLGRKPVETTVDKDIMGGLSAVHLNPNDYFPEPTGTWGRIGRMVGEGAISSVVPGGEETGIARLLQMGKQFVAGGVGGGAAQTVMETPLPDQVKPLASLAAGIAAGGAGLAATEIPETIAKGVSKVGEHITPAFAGDATQLSPEAAANTIAGKLAAQRLGAYAENPEAAISNIQNATELVPGSTPTSAQAAQDRGLLGLERALARNDDKFKAALLDRTDQQNAARVSALDNIESTGDIGSAVQFFHDRMQQLEDHADTLYNRAQQAAEGHYGALGDKTATETGEQARQAIANRFKSMNAETSALWKSIDPTGQLHVATAPLVDAAAKIYGTMSPEGALSLSPSERNVANIIGNYGDTLPFDRFKDLRSEITRAMRESRSFANPNEQAYRRLSMLRDSVEQAVEQSVTHQFETNPSLADQFVRQTKDWYENARTAETGAAPAPSTGAGPVEAARGSAAVSGTAGDQGLEPRGLASDQGLPPDAGVRSQPVLEAPALAPRAPDEPLRPGGAIQALDPQNIGVDARRFQFKEGGDERGVTDRLQGVERWDPRLAGTSLVYRDSAGKDWIADGHQRMGLAKRLLDNGHPPFKVNAFVLDAKDGITEADARAIAAVKNIAEGTGTPIDAAKVLRAARETGIDLPPLPPRSALVRDGEALAQLSPEAFGMVVNEVIPSAQGAIVGRMLKDPAAQEEAVRVLAKLKPDNARMAEMVVRDLINSGVEQMTRQGGLFGEEAFASSVVLERAKIADHALKLLKQDKKLFGTLVDEAERIEGAGNTLNRDVNETRLSTDEKAADLLTQLAFRAGPVSTELTRLARSLKAGDQTPHAAARDFLGAIRRAVESGVDEGADAGSIGARGAEEVTPRDPDTAEMFQRANEIDTEPGVEGLPQTLIPGVRPVTTNDRMQADVRRPLAGGNAPPPKGGLFDEQAASQRDFEERQGRLFQSKSIADTMAQRFAAAGRPEQEAKAAGEVVDAFYNTMAKRLGVPVDKLIEQHPLPQVERGGAGGQFDQAPPPKSEAFKKWFGSSKVVDEHGAPLVVHHWTYNDFDAFDRSKFLETRAGKGRSPESIDAIGNWFSDNPKASYASPSMGGKRIDAYLRMEKPLYFDDEPKRDSFTQLKDFIEREGGATKTRAMLQEQGYDGIVMNGTKLDGHTQNVMIAFDPTQIKSVNNRGTFDPKDPRILFQPAYHGTPHIFDKFELSDKTIGTGEGAQAFGHGLYFAGRKEVAQYYKDTLAGKAMTFKRGTDTIGRNEFEDRVKAHAIGAGSVDGAFPVEARALLASNISRQIGEGVTQGDDLAHMRRFVRTSDWTPRVKAMWDAALSEAETWQGSKPGRLLTVDIPEEHELLDWDKPLSEQPAGVLDKLHAMPAYQQVKRAWAERTGPSFGVSADEAFNHPTNFDGATTAADFYREMSRELAGPPPAQANNWTSVNAGGDSDFRGDTAASAALREAGIPGHRFLDQASRNPKALADAKGSLSVWETALKKNPDDAYIKSEVEARLVDVAKLEAEQSHNYVIYDDSRINVKGYEQPARGSIRFGDTGSVMSMFEGADASTALHESAHHFLHMFRSIADGPNAPEAIAKDWQAANAWWDKNAGDIASEAGNGVTAADVRAALRKGTSGDVAKDRAIDVGLHEQWARGFESYLRDGKAPNPALRSIFEQFRDWLSQVYAHATQLGVKMSPEIKGVFDRMLSTDHPQMMDRGAAGRLSKATAATRELKDTFGAKPVKQILRRPGTTYPYDMSAENVAANLFKPGPEGASSIRNTLRAGAPRETIESAAALSLKRAATKDGVLDPAKVAAWRQKHAEALGEVPELDKRVRTAASASEALADIGQRRKDALDLVQKSAVGKLLNVEDNADVAAVVGRMLGKDTAVKDMRSLVTEARNNPEALAGLRRAVVEHMVSKLKTPKDALRPDTFQRFFGKNAPALAQVLEPEQMQALRSIAQDLKRASRDVRAPGGGSDTAENLAARSKYGLEQPSLLNQIIKRAISSAAIGAGTHFLSGPLVGLASTAGSFLGGTVLQAFREAGLRHVDDLIKEAALHPDLMKALLMKAPKSPKAGSIVKFTDQLGRLAQANLVMSASRDREPHGRKRATVH